MAFKFNKSVGNYLTTEYKYRASQINLESRECGSLTVKSLGYYGMLLQTCLPSICYQGKILMQEHWVCGLDRDNSLPEELSTKMISWFAELKALPEIKVTRCLQLITTSEQVRSISVRVFVDAGIIVYLRVEYKKKRVSISL